MANEVAIPDTGGAPVADEKPAVKDDFDVIIIGGGPGGYVTAIRAAQLGMRTALIEREHLGGICLNWGCIPTKALLRAAEIYEYLQHADEFGLSVDGISFDPGKIVERSRKVAGQLNTGVEHLLKKNGVTIIDAHARLLGSGQVSIKSGDEESVISAAHIIIATGARSRVIPGLEPDGKLVWTYRDAMTPDEMPETLLVVGAGAIGVEFASFYNSFGVSVTLVEMLPQIIPAEDAEIASLAAQSFSRQGIEVFTNTRVDTLKRHDDDVTAHLNIDGSTVKKRFSRVISAVGVVGNHENLGLENTAVAIDGPHIVVDEWLRTAESGVYAIGDVAGTPCLAHKASHEGIACIERIAGLSSAHPVARDSIPACTYSRPQIASVGMTEAQARDAGHDVRVGRFPFRGNGKAIALGETEGMIKTVFDTASGELLGAHMIGAEVTELIQGYTIARKLESTEQELIQTVFPHPTLSEMMHEATLDAYDRVIHF